MSEEYRVLRAGTKEHIEYQMISMMRNQDKIINKHIREKYRPIFDEFINEIKNQNNDVLIELKLLQLDLKQKTSIITKEIEFDETFTTNIDLYQIHNFIDNGIIEFPCNFFDENIQIEIERYELLNIQALPTNSPQLETYTFFEKHSDNRYKFRKEVMPKYIDIAKVCINLNTEIKTLNEPVFTSSIVAEIFDNSKFYITKNVLNKIKAECKESKREYDYNEKLNNKLFDEIKKIIGTKIP